MIAINSLSQIDYALKDAFLHRYPLSGNVRMTGILFARPDSPLTKAEIIPSLPFFHQFSDNHIDIFCAGYGDERLPQDGEDSEEKVVVQIDGRNWRFSIRTFIDVCSEFEKCTRLKYSGGVDLFLANAFFDRKRETVRLDYSSAIVCKLDEMKKDRAFENVEQFILSIVRYTSGAANDDPTWGFSDKQLPRGIGSILMGLILSLIPKPVAEEYKKLRHFAVVDARPRQ